MCSSLCICLCLTVLVSCVLNVFSICVREVTERYCAVVVFFCWLSPVLFSNECVYCDCDLSVSSIC